jgi:hypothetical protein
MVLHGLVADDRMLASLNLKLDGAEMLDGDFHIRNLRFS